MWCTRIVHILLLTQHNTRRIITRPRSAENKQHNNKHTARVESSEGVKNKVQKREMRNTKQQKKTVNFAKYL